MSNLDPIIPRDLREAVETLRTAYVQGRIQEFCETVEGDGVRQPLSWALTIKVRES